jgi:4-carboxymuconolactone decarboxylase
MKGAIANGCTAEEIQDLALMIAIYCGVPASNEAHRIANEVLAAHGKGL